MGEICETEEDHADERGMRIQMFITYNTVVAIILHNNWFMLFTGLNKCI
jgi:hypothetical protein